MYVVICVQYPWRPEEGTRSTGTGMTDGEKPPGTRPRSSATVRLNHWAISPALGSTFECFSLLYLRIFMRKLACHGTSMEIRVHNLRESVFSYHVCPKHAPYDQSYVRKSALPIEPSHQSCFSSFK